MKSTKTELTALYNAVGTLRVRTAVHSEPNAKLIVKCESMEKERDALRNLLVESEKQPATAQRAVIAMTIKSSAARDDDRLMSKTERAVLLKRREEELLADMKEQLHKRHAEMEKQTAEAVEAAVAGREANLARVEGDRLNTLSSHSPMPSLKFRS